MTKPRKVWVALLMGSACVYFYQGVSDGLNALALLFGAVFVVAAVVSTIGAWTTSG